MRFWPVQLRERFLAAATPATPERWLPGVRPIPHRTVLVLHDETAREILPPRQWGIEGRPDLLGRQVDRDHAITAGTWAEAERRTKAGDPTPPAQIHHEVALRMRRERNRAAA